MDTTQNTTGPEHVIDRVRGELLTGQTFLLIARSERSVPLGRPPITRQAWGHCIATLGLMAARSDAFAQIAAAILGRVNLYGTDHEERGHVYQAAAEALAKGFDDVIGRTGPGAGRASAYQRDYTLAERIELVWWLNEATRHMQSGSVPAVGWTLQALTEREHVTVPQAAKGTS